MAHWYRKKIADRRAQPQGKSDLKINTAIGMPKEESHIVSAKSSGTCELDCMTSPEVDAPQPIAVK